MSNGEADVDVEVEQPHAHVAHRSGHHWLDKVLPICALFVSFVSIWIAWHHGEVMQDLVHQNERLVQANSLPHLEISGSNNTDTGERRITFTVTNAGVGPAEIRSARILVDGRPVSGIRELAAGCCGDGARFAGLSTSTLLGTMVRPGQTLRYIDFPVTPQNQAAAIALDRARMSDRIETQLCYCSVFDECWLRSSAGGKRPRPVEQCPAAEPQYLE